MSKLRGLTPVVRFASQKLEVNLFVIRRPLFWRFLSRQLSKTGIRHHTNYQTRVTNKALRAHQTNRIPHAAQTCLAKQFVAKCTQKTFCIANGRVDLVARLQATGMGGGADWDMGTKRMASKSTWGWRPQKRMEQSKLQSNTLTGSEVNVVGL